MSNTGLQITTIQNEETNIKFLAAQKELYSTAKVFFVWQCIIVGPLAVLVSLSSIFLKNTVERFAWVFALYTIFALLAELVLDAIISKIKKKAATIQEQFDHQVLGIVWNNTMITRKVQLEEIYKFYRRHAKKNALNPVYDWYSPSVSQVNTNLATVLCQRTNCSYDFVLRKRFSNTILIVAIVIFVILFIISAITGLTTQSFIVEVLAPAAPIFILAWKQISANREAINNLSSLRDLIEALINNVSINSEIDEGTIRQIQDKIYHNRILNPLLPDWIFKKFRSKLEEGMHFSIEQQIQSLNRR